MKTAIKARKIYSEDKVLENAVLIMEDGYIVEVDENFNSEGYEQFIDYGECELIPGLIDPHIHGANGFDTMDSSITALNTISVYLTKYGVTGFLPTTVSDDFDKIKNAVMNVAENKDRVAGAKILGSYVEGPYITEQHKGAHDPRFIRELNVCELRDLIEEGKGTIKIMTVAPEKTNSKECIEYLRKNDVNVSMGHTNATYAETIEAVESGANVSVHTFNGMRGFNHREPGLLGAVLTDDRVYCEVISDMVHCHPAALKLLIKCKPEDKIILISDSMMAGGLKDGIYDLGSSKVTVKDGIARTENQSLAGSTTNVLQCVRNLVEEIGVPKETALKMASLNASKLLGLEGIIGSIKKGKKADFALIDKDYKVHATYIEGRLVRWQKGIV